MGRKTVTLALNQATPMILDCTIDYDGSNFYARSDIDHQVNIPSDQSLVVDKETGELKTIIKE